MLHTIEATGTSEPSSTRSGISVFLRILLWRVQNEDSSQGALWFRTLFCGQSKCTSPPLHPGTLFDEDLNGSLTNNNCVCGCGKEYSND